MQRATSIIEILFRRGLDEPNKLAYSFLHFRSENESLTYGRLTDAVKRVASHLREISNPAERAVLIYPPGLDFIVSFFGCMAAGLVPVPVYPLMGSRPERSIARIRHVISDAECRLILTSTALRGDLQTHLDQMLPAGTLLATDEIANGISAPHELPLPRPEDLALLQYTSGSTALPRGVMIVHGNLLANSAAISESYGLDSEARVVSWLPPYHDMGLIGGILQPVYAGFPGTLMAPHAFLQSPVRWLEAISKTAATISMSPNFGYDLCVRKIDSAAIDGLDLSNWRTAICGAERVSYSTLESFARKFRPAGFRMESFCPSYGLAESTLLVSTSAGIAPVARSFDRDALKKSRYEVCHEDERGARLLVGNGVPVRGIEIRIVDPVSFRPCADGQVGEVWVSGTSVSRGYWNKPDLNASVFPARIEGVAGQFLRTGDTGFVHDGQLFVAGRTKDLIILSGRNHAPEDIEAAVRESHPVFTDFAGAAFSIDADGQEILVVVHEVGRHALKPDRHAEGLFRIVHRALFSENVRADAIVFLRPGTIPRTSSGKVQRHRCRDAFICNTLHVAAEWLSPRAQRTRPVLTRAQSIP